MARNFLGQGRKACGFRKLPRSGPISCGSVFACCGHRRQQAVQRSTHSVPGQNWKVLPATSLSFSLSRFPFPNFIHTTFKYFSFFPRLCLKGRWMKTEARQQTDSNSSRITQGSDTVEPKFKTNTPTDSDGRRLHPQVLEKKGQSRGVSPCTAGQMQTLAMLPEPRMVKI